MSVIVLNMVDGSGVSQSPVAMFSTSRPSSFVENRDGVGGVRCSGAGDEGEQEAGRRRERQTASMRTEWWS